jgi:hypothetical protein
MRSDQAAMRFTAAATLALSCSLIVSGNLPAAAPRDELLRLAPADAGFVLVVQNWRQHLAELNRSPVVARLATTPFGQALRASPEARRLGELDEQLRANLGVSWAQIRDEILGDALVLSYTPGPQGRPEAEVGLLLVHVRQPERLAALLGRMDELQIKAGDLKGRDERTYRKTGYVVRHKKDGQDEYRLVHKQWAAFSDKESAIKALIERDWDENNIETDRPLLANRLRDLGVDNEFAVLWLNPRAFDAAVASKVAAARGAEAAFLATFERYWKAIDGAAVSVAAGRDLSVKFAVQAKAEKLPAAARRLMAESATPSALWTTFPQSALFAAAGHVPWDPAIEAGSEFLTAERRKSIQDGLERTVGALFGGRDLLSHVLRHLGPDWGMYVTAPEAGDKGWLPSLTAVLRLRPAGDGSPSVEQRALDGLDFAARLVVLTYNSQAAGLLKLRMEAQDGVEVRVIEGSRLPGLQPAFAWKGGYLVLASTPDAVRRFVPPSKAPPSDATDAEVPLVRLALQGWATYLRSYRGPVTNYVADVYHLPAAEADTRVGRLIDGLDLFDAVEVVRRSAPGRAVWVVRLKTLTPDEKPH